MKKLLAAILSAVVLTGLVSVGVSAKDDPKVVSTHIVDSAEKSVEINFSEPVNIKNLGWIVAVNQYPNGSNPYATFDWGKMTFHLYGYVDKDGKPLGDNGYLLNTTGDSANEGVYTTRIVTYLGEIGQQAEGGSTVSDLHGIEFQNLNQGLFTTADGRTVKGGEDGKLYVEFTAKQTKKDPTVTSVHLNDKNTGEVEIVFSEPVNIKNLGWIVAVNQYPNGSNPYATFDWGKMTFHLYGCVDKDGKPLGDNGYLLNTTGDRANEGVYTTRIVTYLGEIGQQAEGGSSYSDLRGIEFQNLGQGLFTAADGRTVKGDTDGRLYVAFSDKEKPIPPETADGTTAAAVICLTAALVSFCLRKKRI